MRRRSYWADLLIEEFPFGRMVSFIRSPSTSLDLGGIVGRDCVALSVFAHHLLAIEDASTTWSARPGKIHIGPISILLRRWINFSTSAGSAPDLPSSRSRLA